MLKAGALPDTESAGRKYLAFSVGERTYAVPADLVSEIVRIGVLARVPQAPAGLAGLANLRGRVTPVASLKVLLGDESSADTDANLALLLTGDAPVAVSIEGAPVLVGTDEVRTSDLGVVARPEECVIGIFALDEGAVARVVDIRALLLRCFTPRAAPAKERPQLAVGRQGGTRNDEPEDEKFISFLVAGQEFALELDAVREIIVAPDVVAAVPHAEDLVVGVTAYRESLLPLLSLRGLLGLGAAAQIKSGKVVVARIGGTLVGLVADSAEAIVSVAEGESDPPPAVLAARAGAEAQIKAIYRGEGGRRLVSILAPDQLLRDDVMQRLSKAHAANAASTGDEEETSGDVDRFLIFRLGDEEYALPIETVIEVARVPEQITRVPKTPAFLEGVISFRGEVLPVVDQRRRFDMPVRDGDASRRLIMIRSDRHRAALIVDGVSEVLTHARDRMDGAPDLAGEQRRLVLGVINLEAAKRMILVLDPVELLSRTERGLLDAFTPEQPQSP